MDERTDFGWTGEKVSPMGMGTYYDPGWIASAKLLKRQPRSDSILKAIRKGLENGINLIDTAELYGSENLVGEAIQGFDRDNLFIATKVWPSHFSYDKVIKACDKSLRNLGIKQIDLYQLHFPSKIKGIAETMRAMEDLVKQGKIRYIGISNFSLKQTIEAAEALKSNRIASTQMNYSVAHRDIEKDLLPYCTENEMAILAYYPLGHGRLVESSSFSGSVIEEIGKNHGGKSAPQIALNWFYSKHKSVFPIPRASNPDHVEENAKAIGWKMTDSEIELLEKSLS